MNQYFLTCPRGLEEITKVQISNYINTPITLDKGGIHFNGTTKDMYLTNLHSRTGMRLLKKIFSLTINEPNNLYSNIYNLRWGEIIAVNKTFSIRTKLKTRLFTNSSHTTLKIKDAIVDNIRKQFGNRPSINKLNPDISLFVFINDKNIKIYIDTSGDPLFKRGYKTQIHKASLNEALAAGLVLLSAWNKKNDFYDIMCGSGTIPIEAAMIAYNIAPGLYRNKFAFQGFTNYNKSLWDNIYQDAINNINIDNGIKINGYDHIKENIDLGINSAKIIGLQDNIRFSVSNIIDIKTKKSPGTLIINPPYGNRIGDNNTIPILYKNIGDVFKKKFGGFDAYIFSGNLQAIKSVGLRSKKRIILKNGTIDCRLVYYPMTTGKFD